MLRVDNTLLSWGLARAAASFICGGCFPIFLHVALISEFFMLSKVRKRVVDWSSITSYYFQFIFLFCSIHFLIPLPASNLLDINFCLSVCKLPGFKKGSKGSIKVCWDYRWISADNRFWTNAYELILISSDFY